VSAFSLNSLLLEQNINIWYLNELIAGEERSSLCIDLWYVATKNQSTGINETWNFTFFIEYLIYEHDFQLFFCLLFGILNL